MNIIKIIISLSFIMFFFSKVFLCFVDKYFCKMFKSLSDLYSYIFSAFWSIRNNNWFLVIIIAANYWISLTNPLLIFFQYLNVSSNFVHNMLTLSQTLLLHAWQAYTRNSLVQCIISYLPNPSTRAGYDTRSAFKRSLTGLNSEFSFS